MTLELTSSGTLGWEHDPRHNGTEDEEMIYTVDQSQLLRLWSVIRCFGDIREIPDPEVQAAILTKAQILLTAFVLDLEPVAGEQTASAETISARDHMARFDAE